MGAGEGTGAEARAGEGLVGVEPGVGARVGAGEGTGVSAGAGEGLVGAEPGVEARVGTEDFPCTDEMSEAAAKAGF